MAWKPGLRGMWPGHPHTDLCPCRPWHPPSTGCPSSTPFFTRWISMNLSPSWSTTRNTWDKSPPSSTTPTNGNSDTRVLKGQGGLGQLLSWQRCPQAWWGQVTWGLRKGALGRLLCETSGHECSFESQALSLELCNFGAGLILPWGRLPPSQAVEREG